MHHLISRNISLLVYLPEALRRLVGKPLPTSFYSRAFFANLLTANAVAATRYLQSMHDGTLNPLDYGSLTIQDAYYCYHAQDTLKELLDRIDREKSPDLYDLVASKASAYDNYNRTFLEDWHIRDAECVLPTDGTRAYVAHEQRVAREEEPIYSLVAFLPCYNLWPWFARQLMASPRYNPGIYRDWFEGVYEGEVESFGGAWALGSFIEEWKDGGGAFDESLAHDIYRTSMEFELRMFREACTEE